MARLRVLVADDHRLMLTAIRRALELTGEIEVVAEVGAGSQVLPAIARTAPDVVLLDIRMPELDGLACLARIREREPKLPVVILSAFADLERIELARERGASGYVVKAVDPIDLAAIVLRIVEEGVFSLHSFEEEGEHAAGSGGLTERELTVLTAVARGLSNRQIGKELWVTEQTVKFHLANIYRKLEISSRTEAARYAFRHIPSSSPAAPGLLTA